MADITFLKQKRKLQLRKLYGCNDTCHSSICWCDIFAEMHAYSDSIIPTEVRYLGIDDFNGLSSNMDEIIETTIVREAKWKIISYCWKMPEKGNEDVALQSRCLEKFNAMNNYERDKGSIMESRREQGINVAIFSKHNKGGRSLAAAIIIKEAIRRHVYVQRSWTYDWVEYEMLLNYLKKESEESFNLESADWLVIDNIVHYHVSENQRAYRNSLIDPFLFKRIKEQRPTVLVFRFDIRDKQENIETDLGGAIAKIVSNPNTFLVPLSIRKGIIEN